MTFEKAEPSFILSPSEYECLLSKHEALTRHTSTRLSAPTQHSWIGCLMCTSHMRSHEQQVSTVILLQEDPCGLPLPPHVVHASILAIILKSLPLASHSFPLEVGRSEAAIAV